MYSICTVFMYCMYVYMYVCMYVSMHACTVQYVCAHVCVCIQYVLILVTMPVLPNKAKINIILIIIFF